MNIDDPVTVGQQLTLWENNGTGDFESLYDNDTEKDGVTRSEYEFSYTLDAKGKPLSAIDCMLDGLGNGSIDLKNGLKYSIEPEVQQLVDLWKPTLDNPDAFVYVLSLASIPTDPVNYINAKSVQDGIKKDSATIPLGEIVLLKCQIVSFSSKPQDRGIVLKYIGPEPINLGDAVRDKTYIPGFANSTYRIKLID